MTRDEMVKAQHTDASDETIRRYIDLREEGYPAYQAKLMAGLIDPPESEE